jgi:hypothetical protein
MNNIVQFIPRADLDALSNLNAFVAVCKDKLTVFGASLPFENNTWVVTEDINLKGKSSAVRLVFSSWSTVEDKEPQPMKEPFLSFAKSYVRYQHSLRPTKAVGPRLAALRALEAALNEFAGVPNAALVTHQVLDRAAQLIASKFTPAVAYRVGGQLQMVSDLLVDHRSVAVLNKWLNPISRPLVPALAKNLMRKGSRGCHRR